MSDDLIKNNINAASFYSKEDGLTDGQRYLLNLLTKRIKENVPITREDITDCYFHSCSKDGKTIRVREFNYSAYGGNTFKGVRYLTNQDKYIQQKALVWFKQNLGTCIIKGKLLVIPVIDIEEQKQIEG